MREREAFRPAEVSLGFRFEDRREAFRPASARVTFLSACHMYLATLVKSRVDVNAQRHVGLAKSCGHLAVVILPEPQHRRVMVWRTDRVMLCSKP